MVTLSFDEVLRRLVAERDGSRDAAAARTIWQRPLNINFGNCQASAQSASRMYFDTLEEPIGVVVVSDEEFVSQQLQLSDDLTLAQLQHIRRRFAMNNHPDRVGAAYQATALSRMQMANNLIDQELERRRSHKS